MLTLLESLSFVPIPSSSSLMLAMEACLDVILFCQLPSYVWVAVCDHCLGKNLGLPIVVLAPIVDASLVDVASF